MTHTIRELFRIYPDSDIYVLGSGASLGYCDPAFFENKIVVCVNFTIEYIKKAKKLYLVAKEPDKRMQDAAVARKASIVMCKHHSGVPTNAVNNVYHPDSTFMFDPATSVIKDKNQRTALERSSSTIVTGIHLAAFLGAKTIILVGHDCGHLDDNMHLPNYNKKGSVMKGDKAYEKWMQNNKVEKKSIDAKNLLKQFHGVNVYSLNPFINFNLEGHKFKPFK